MLTYNSWGTEYKIKLGLDNYSSNDNLAIVMYCWDEELKFWDNFATLTVNLEPVDEDCGYLDVNNLKEAEDWVRENKLGEPTGRVRQSGYVTYPLYKFDLQRIKSIIAEQENE